MNTIELTIGLTQSNRAENYFPSMDGYKLSAGQDTYTLDYPDYMETAEEVAERVFIATNAPDEMGMSEPQRHMRALLTGLLPRSVSVGDTVTYDGTTLVCARVGWEPLAPGKPSLRANLARLDEEALAAGAAAGALVETVDTSTTVITEECADGCGDDDHTPYRCTFENANGRCTRHVWAGSTTKSCATHEVGEQPLVGGLSYGIQRYTVTIDVDVDLDQYRRAYPHLEGDSEVRRAVVQDLIGFGSLGMVRDSLRGSMVPSVPVVEGHYGTCGLCTKRIEKPSYVRVGGDPAHEACASRWLSGKYVL